MKVKNIMFFGFAAAILSAGAANAANTTAYDALTGRTPNASEKNIVTSKYYVDTGVKALRDDVASIEIPDVTTLQAHDHTHSDGTNTTAVTEDGVVTINVPGVSTITSQTATTALPTVGALTSYVSGENANKQDRENPAAAGTIAIFDADGDSVTSSKEFETAITANSDAKVPTSKAVADYITAGHASYSNTTSGLTAVNVQAAIDEVEGRLDNVETTAADVSNKQDKDTDAVVGNIADFDANGNSKDSGKTFTGTVSSTSTNAQVPTADAVYTAITTATADISDKQDKDTDAVTGNIADFDANGNSKDSGKTFDTASGTITANSSTAIPSSAQVAGYVATQIVPRPATGNCSASDTEPCALVAEGNTMVWRRMAQ